MQPLLGRLDYLQLLLGQLLPKDVHVLHTYVEPVVLGLCM